MAQRKKATTKTVKKSTTKTSASATKNTTKTAKTAKKTSLQENDSQPVIARSEERTTKQSLEPTSPVEIASSQASPAPRNDKSGFGGHSPNPAPYAEIGRICITNISPVHEGGSWPVKGTENEAFPVHANVFREGHDMFGAEAVLVNPDGEEVQARPMYDIAPGLNRYEAWLTPTSPGRWQFFVRAWSDPLATWWHNAEARIGANTDIDLVFLEADALLRRLDQKLQTTEERDVLDRVRAITRNAALSPHERFAQVTCAAVTDLFDKYPLRELVTESARFPVNVDRERALYGSWYEFFPRSCGAHKNKKGEWVSGTFKTAAKELDRVAEMGFNVIYLTPIHPIGLTNRKGKDNTLVAAPEDPGSPYAIGSEAGGHDAIHPDLGTEKDFADFVGKARAHGMEVALDFALQCSPDHPWLTEHPEWFTTRVDGTIAFAENPPKKYQDIYPINFDNDPEGIYAEIWRVLELWIERGVTIFRVDNPHTKPVAFWQRLLGQMRAEHPEVIFLAEAFTKPPMLQSLGAVGFHLSYTYFTWRNEKGEIEEYLRELAHDSAPRVRPAFFPTTPDILTSFMVYGGVNAFHIRAILAATGAPTWGIYSGYELAENVQRPGAEEFIENEKYEYKDRDYEAARANGIADLLGKLNEIRAGHTALQRLRHMNINPTSSDRLVSFTKWALPEETKDGKPDAVIVVLNLDPAGVHEGQVYLDLAPLHALGLPYGEFEVHDELSGETFVWNDAPYVKLTPGFNCAHILSVQFD